MVPCQDARQGHRFREAEKTYATMTSDSVESYFRSIGIRSAKSQAEVWKSIDDLQKTIEAVPHADRSGPEWGGDGELSKRFIELMKRLGDIGHQFRLGLAAIEQSNVISNKKN